MAGGATPGPGSAAREAGRWFAQAGHDLDDAAFAAAGGRHALACFLCQQAAEKSITALLFARGAEHVWGHALADLCEDALAFDPSVELVKPLAILLDKHYLAARYPSALPGGVPAEVYDHVDSERALVIARAVVEFTRERIAST